MYEELPSCDDSRRPCDDDESLNLLDLVQSNMVAKQSASLHINLQVEIAHGAPITNELLGRKIAESLGFTTNEMELFASERGFPSGTAAFWQLLSGADEQIEMDKVRQIAAAHPSGLFAISELTTDAVRDRAEWLAEHRKNSPFNQRPHVKLHERTAMETVETHLVNPVLNFSSAALESLANIGDGAAFFSAHNPYQRWLLRESAEFLRRQGKDLPMNDLYTPAEKQDVALGLLTLYVQAFGDNAPTMFTGPLLRAGLKTVGAVESVAMNTFVEKVIPTAIGSAASAGQAYDAAMTLQAHNFAVKQHGEHLSRQALEEQIRKIKRGEGIDPATVEEMHKKATIAAAISAGAGGMEGFAIGKLVSKVRDGTPIDSIPQQLFDDVGAQLRLGNSTGTARSFGALIQYGAKELAIGTTTGAALGAISEGTNQFAMASAGVKTPEQAFRDFVDNAGTAVEQSAFLFGTGQLLAIRPKGQRELEEARLKSDERYIPYQALKQGTAGEGILDGTSYGVMLPRPEYSFLRGAPAAAVKDGFLEYRVYFVKGASTKIAVPEDYAVKLDQVRKLRNVASQNLLSNPGEFRKIWRARQELSQHPSRDAMLPEQLALLLHETPNGNRVSMVELHEKRFDDRAGDATLDHIRLFAEGAGATPGGQSAFLHEWSHTADFERRQGIEGRFRLSAQVERNEFYEREYARTNDNEDFAVHMGESFLAEDPEAFYRMAENAPLRSVALAVTLEREIEVSSHFRSPHKEHLMNRIQWVKEKSVPQARRKLISELETRTSEKGLRDVLVLIEDLQAYQSTRDLFGQDFLRDLHVFADLRLQHPGASRIFPSRLR